MTDLTCREAIEHIQAGALLRAGLPLDSAGQQRLQDHLAGCAQCRAQAGRVGALDDLLRSTLHARWDDAAVLPDRTKAKDIHTKLRAQTMKRNLLTITGVVVMLALFGVLFFNLREISPGGMLSGTISGNFENALLQMEDLPADTIYYIIDQRAFTSWNEWVLDMMGKEKGQAFIDDTGRLTGWRVTYQRSDPDDPGLEHIDSSIVLYETPEGARNAIENYIIDSQIIDYYPWEPLGPVAGLGDRAFAYKSTWERGGQWEWTFYLVQVAYRNASVQIRVSDFTDRVTLDDAVRLAQVVLDRMKARP